MTDTTATPIPTETRVDEVNTAERAAHNALALIANHPGQFGRLRCARIVGGFSVNFDSPETAATIAPHASVVLNWSLRAMVDLIDALLHGGLLAQTTGQRPTLVLTRAGFRALDALDPPTQA